MSQVRSSLWLKLLRFSPLVGLAVALLLRDSLAESNARRRELLDKTPPDASIARYLHFGHRSSLADLYWLDVLPDLSAPFASQQRKVEWMYNSAQVITDLEPGYTTVYRYCASYLAIVLESTDRAVKLLERAVDRNPDSLRLMVELGMLYLSLDRHDAAIGVLAMADQHPDCDELTKGTYSALLVEERYGRAALAPWQPHYDHPNPDVRRKARLNFHFHLLGIARRGYEEFRQAMGRPPVGRELIAERWLNPDVHQLVEMFCEWGEGGVRSAEYEQLYRADKRVRVELWAREYRVEHGDWPTDDELREEQRTLALPLLEKGHRYALREHELVTVDENGTVHSIPD